LKTRNGRSTSQSGTDIDSGYPPHGPHFSPIHKVQPRRGSSPRSPVASTALFVAAVRAREQERPDRLFQDDLSSLLAGPEGLAWLAESESNPASNYHRESFPYIEVRTRFFDDWALGAIEDGGARQFVILGAGMDTRAFRLSWPPGVRLLEVDTPELFALKEARLQSAGARPNCLRVVVEADLTSPDWPGLLTAAGFDKRTPTVWLAEGLFQYLTAKAVKQILDGAASLSARDSRFGAEIISADYLRSRSKAATLRTRKERGTPWVFGTNNPESIFSAHDWAVDGRASALEEAVALKRWPARNSNGSALGPSGASFVLATKSERPNRPSSQSSTSLSRSISHPPGRQAHTERTS
jgi:methyltransferase (TIGR00027 family)